MPIADALAIFFIEPFILTILSAVVDKEHVGWRRRIAVAAGFVGRPDRRAAELERLRPHLARTGAGWGALRRLCAPEPAPLGIRHAAHDAVHRRPVGARDHDARSLSSGRLPAFADLSASTGRSAREARAPLLMGVFGTTGHVLFVQAAQLAPVSLIAPMQYVEIVCAAIARLPGFRRLSRIW